MRRATLIILVVVMASISVIAGCGSSEPTGKLTSDEALVVKDMRLAAREAVDDLDVIERIIDMQPTAKGEAEVKADELDIAANNWAGKELPSDRLGRARDMLVDLQEQTSGALKIAAAGFNEPDVLSEAVDSAAGVASQNVALEEELDRLEALR